MPIRYRPGDTVVPQDNTREAYGYVARSKAALALTFDIFKPKVPSNHPDALEFREDRLQALLDNFTELLRKIDPESTHFYLDDFGSADLLLEDEETGETEPMGYNVATFRNNHWDIFLQTEVVLPTFQFDIVQKHDDLLPAGRPAVYRDMQSVAKAVEKAIELSADGINLRLDALRRQAHAQGLAELNAQMGRKGLALPLGVLGDTYSFLEPMRPHPEPGHAKRRSAAKSLIARERQERLTSNQMNFLQNLSPEDRESAYAMLGGKRSKRSKKRTRASRNRSARKALRRK
jgi:hypothetical protein